MDKVENVERMRTESIHHIFCDKCGKELSHGPEWDDGYYENVHHRRYSFHAWRDGSNEVIHFENNPDLCDDCANGVVEKIKEIFDQI